jgi:hypothetical protein
MEGPMKVGVKSAIVLVLLAASGDTVSPQTVRLNQVMRNKLEHSQRILEAVVTSNWSLLDKESRALGAVTRDPAWNVLQLPEYGRYSAAFLQATGELAEAAELRDLEAASLGFVSLSTSCVSCHRYMTRSRVVGPRR